VSVRETLTAALALLERGWCQRAFARNRYDVVVPEKSEFACKWCIAGALWASAPDIPTMNACRALVRSITRYDVTIYNDAPTTKQADAVRVVREALALC
jgi:hypothetical protein